MRSLQSSWPHFFFPPEAAAATATEEVEEVETLKNVRRRMNARGARVVLMPRHSRSAHELVVCCVQFVSRVFSSEFREWDREKE